MFVEWFVTCTALADFACQPYIAPVLRKALHLDVIAICARVAVMLNDPREYRELHSLRAAQAQDMLLLLQSVSSDMNQVSSPSVFKSDCRQHLDYPPLDPRLRRTLVTAAIKLSRKSGCYPECLVRSDIQKNGQIPQAVGRFGDVWKGCMQGQDIAVKVLRVYVRTDMVQFLKARS
jgi:hypothetical protein